MNNIRVTLESTYPQLKDQAPVLANVLIAVLTRYTFDSISDYVPNTTKTVAEIIELGFFRLDEDNVLTCPFVLVWLFATWSRKPVLSHFKLEAYSEQENPSLPRGMQFWQHWEEFVGQFRMLKSILLAGKTVPVTTLHAGAEISDEASTLNIEVTEIKTLHRAVHQYDTTGIGFYFISVKIIMKSSQT